MLIAVTTLLILLVFFLWCAHRLIYPRVKRRPIHDVAIDERYQDEDETSIEEDIALVEPLTVEDIWPELEDPGPKQPISHTTDAPSPSQLGEQSALNPVSESPSTHDGSAIELAETMMSFGRLQGAVQTLAEYIRTHPQHAVKPWLKLLEIYWAANLRDEFEALAQRINQTFNIKPISWASFELTQHIPHSLEGFPHIVEQLQHKWGTVQCQEYLHGLLRDNRDGTRQGFPLSVVEEILLLYAVLAQQLGPYKPPSPYEAQTGRSRNPISSHATAFNPSITDGEEDPDTVS